MKFAVAALAVVAFASSEAGLRSKEATHGYHKRFGVFPQKNQDAEWIQQDEDSKLIPENGYIKLKIIGGQPTPAGIYPWQAGLIVYISDGDVAHCGASLVSASRLVTAAHCWSDGEVLVWKIEVVLGSNTLYTGGRRVHTRTVAVHPDYDSEKVINDIAIIYLPYPVSFSKLIAPISLPTGSELNESFAGELATATGFGLTNHGTSNDLYHVHLRVIENSVCAETFEGLDNTSICTSGEGPVGICGGDSGGPLVITRNNRSILIGVTSFGSVFGCEESLPSVFVRVTAYIDFIKKHLN